MSDESDSSLNAQFSQSKSHDKCEIIPSEHRAVLINKLLAWAVTIVESDAMRVLETRICLLVSGGWLPGKGDVRTIAALTNRPADSIEDLANDCCREKTKVGRQAFYSLADFAKPAEKPPTAAPAMRAGKKK